ncbi:BMC domain-containing protein [Anaerotruncus rubiinfantis]|uniref:BMC domain-containing protein n=1 Tax=Anaerotruncus rubiinfantis TaxID=1720200 RepID=UPI00082DAAE5|nr:BMC domain-containing protein [Anaerotruncus rubiinfantis]
MELKGKERIIQEFVPGKQITLAHIIANPDESLYQKMGLVDGKGALGIFTITPSEGAIIAADVAAKSAEVQVGFVDRFNGSLVITGDVAAIHSAAEGIMDILCAKMGFTPTSITKT